MCTKPPEFIMVFDPPPLDLPLEYVLDFHLQNNPDHVAITYPREDGNDLKSYTYKELIPAIHRAGQLIVEDAGISESLLHTSPVVAIVIKTDSVTYLTVIAGLLRAGMTPFPISPRFPPSVVAHLLDESRPAAILVNESTREIVLRALNGSESNPSLCNLPPFHLLFSGCNEYTPLPKHKRKPEDICVLMHSSSSTANFPKLISYSGIAVTHHGEIKDFPLQDLAGRVLGCFGMEIFHSYGMCVFFTMVRKGLVLAMMNPVKSTSILPAEISDVYRCFQICKPEMLQANPRAVEIWAEDPLKVAELRDSGVTIYYGGRFLNKNVGDRLVQSGVRICTAYGGTESGPISLFPHFQGEDWEYFAVYPQPDVNFVSRGNDALFELFVAPTEEFNYLACVNAFWKGTPAYNPGDLFLAHPQKPHTYKMFGRTTDQIMLATGQAINPIAIEEELSKTPLIKSAVMFGHTRFKLGLIVEAPHSLCSENEQGSFLDNIWPIVEGINMKSPIHTRITRDMIICATPTKPISMSPKGYPRRAIVWLDYQDEIDDRYSDDQKVRR